MFDLFKKAKAAHQFISFTKFEKDKTVITVQIKPTQIGMQFIIESDGEPREVVKNYEKWKGFLNSVQNAWLGQGFKQTEVKLTNYTDFITQEELQTLKDTYGTKI